MKYTTIHLEYDSEVQTVEGYEIEVYAATNGILFHKSLVEIFNILFSYETVRKRQKKGRKLSELELEVIRDLQSKISPHLAGIRHEYSKRKK